MEQFLKYDTVTLFGKYGSVGRDVPEIKMTVVPRWVKETKCYTVLESLQTGKKILGGKFWFQFSLGLCSKTTFIWKKLKLVVFLFGKQLFSTLKNIGNQYFPPDLLSC